MALRSRLRSASVAAATHFLLSAALLLILWLGVVRNWYPHPYDQLAGGLALLGMIFAVDVVCGPLLTLIVYNPAKSRRERVFDLSVIVAIQLAALLYGIYSVAQARPVVLAFEVDRFVAVPAAGVDVSQLSHAPKGFESLSWSGPRLIGTRAPRDAKEQMSAVQLGMDGLEISARPDWWEPYDVSRPRVKERMKPLAELLAKATAQEKALIEKAVDKVGKSMDAIYYLPMTGQKRDDFIALLDEKGDIEGFVNVDAFAYIK